MSKAFTGFAMDAQAHQKASKKEKPKKSLNSLLY
jgi:hypothetical protein